MCQRLGNRGQRSWAHGWGLRGHLRLGRVLRLGWGLIWGQNVPDSFLLRSKQAARWWGVLVPRITGTFSVWSELRWGKGRELLPSVDTLKDAFNGPKPFTMGGVETVKGDVEIGRELGARVTKHGAQPVGRRQSFTCSAANPKKCAWGTPLSVCSCPYGIAKLGICKRLQRFINT